MNWLKNFAVSKDYATSDDYSKALDGANSWISELKTQKKEYELERRRAYKYNSKETQNKLAEYDKQIKQAKKDRDALESGKELKRRDDIIQGEMSVQNNADFSDVSSNREFGNPNREELGKYDIRNNAKTWTIDAQGNYYNALGEKIGKDINAYTSKYADNGISDKLGLYLSTSDSERKEAAAGRTYGDTWATAINEGTDNNWQELSENEKAVYYYYLNKGERDKAYKFLDDMGYQLGLRANEKQKAELEGANALELIAANAASVPANVFGGIIAFADDALNTVRGKDVNPYNSAHQFVNSAGNTRDVAAQKIADSIDNDVISALVSNGYQAVMSGADSLLGAATLGSGYTVTMGMGAASQKAKELYENGASRGQIALGSLASGAIEWITEKFSYDFIVDKLWNNPKSGRALIKAVLASAANEGIEEVNSDILNMVSDAIIQGGNSVSEREVRELINNTGVSEEEARNTVAAQNAINTFWSFYGGFISGGLMSGGGLALNLGQNALMNAAYETEYKKQSGKNIVDGDNVNALVEVARGLDDTKANNKLKALAEQIAATDTEKLSARQQKAFSNKVGKLYSEVQKAQATVHSESAGNAVRTAIEEKVREKGVSNETDLKTATNAIYKTVYDEGKLSSSEDRLLKKYDLNGIATELLNDEKNVIARADKAENETRGAYFETAKLADTDNASARNVDTSGYNISDSGKTYRNDTGEEVKITGISTIKNGKMTVNLSDGSSTALDNISLGSDNDAILYEGVLQMGVSAGSAQMIVKSYSPAIGMSPLNYIRGVEDAVKYGKIGSKAFLNSGVFSGALPEQIRNSMYRVGEIEAERAAQKKAKAKEKYARKHKNVKNKIGSVSFKGIDRNNLNERQKVSVNAVETVFGEMGINVVFFQSETNENGAHIGKNGSYDPETNTIELDISAGVQGKDTVLFTAAHELTHFIAEWSPDKFRAFANFLVENYEKKGINVNQVVEERMLAAEENGRELDYDTAFEEVIADSCESFLRDSHLADRLAELAKADMTLFEKIKSYIKGLLEKVRKAYAGLLPDSKEGRFVLEMKESLEQLHDMWENAALDARGNFKSVGNERFVGKGAKKYSIAYTTDNKPVAVIDEDILDGVPKSQWIQTVKDTISSKFSDGIPISGRLIKVNKITRSEYTNSKYSKFLKSSDGTMYQDKLKTANNLDDVVLASTNYINEDLKHSRKDSFKEFARGDVLIRVGGNDYSAKVIVGFTNSRQMVLYDVVDFNKAAFKIKKRTSQTAMQNAGSDRNGMSYDTTVPQKEQSVNTNISENTQNDAKKFSERDPVAAEAYAEINKQLEKEKAEMSEDLSRAKELVKLQNKLTHGTVFTDSSMDVAVRTLMNYVNAKGEKSEFKELLKDFYSYIAKGEDVSWESVKEKSEPVISWLRDHEYHKAQRSEFANNILKELRTMRVSLNAEQKLEAANLYGSYENFRKRNMGRIIFTDSGVSLDTQWAELSKAYPALFDENITSTEQPIELMSIIEDLQNSDINEYFFSDEMAEQDLFSKVYDTYWNVSTLHTVKDRMQTEINKLKFKHNEKIRKMRENHAKKESELKRRYAEKAAETRKKYKSRTNKSQIRGSIRKVINDLNSLLNHGTKKKNVKEELRDTVSAALYSAELLFSPAITNEEIVRNGIESVTAKENKLIKEYSDLLDKRDDYSERIKKLGDMPVSEQRTKTITGLQNMIDYINREIDPLNRELHSLFERERNRMYKAPATEAINALADAYSALKNSESAYIRNVYDDFVFTRIVSLKDAFKDGVLIKDMNTAQLTEIRDAYKMVLHTVREANKLFGDEKKATVTEMADRVSAEIRKVGGSKEKQPVLTSFLKKQGWKFLKPVYAFRTIGSNTLTELYNDIRNGEDIFKRMIDKAIEAYKSTGQKYNSSKWDTEKTYTFQSRNGKEFSLSLQQIMEIYGYSKRNQAMKHLVQGGIVLDNSVIVKEKTRFGVPLKYEVNAADA